MVSNEEVTPQREVTNYEYDADGNLVSRVRRVEEAIREAGPSGVASGKFDR